MSWYAGIDLHANSHYLAIVDGEGKRVLSRKVRNEPSLVLEVLAPFRERLVEVAVESTFNWYWLVDLLMEHGFTVRLANPVAIQKYSGLKYADDRHDAFWLAEMLRLRILPQSFIYPREDRPLRDLLRKRGHLVRLRTSLITSLQNTIARNCGRRLPVNDVKRLTEDRVSPLLQGSEDLALAGQVSKEAIDFLTRKIRRLEAVVEKRFKTLGSYENLLTLPGVGRVLGLTIMLETGPIGRFPKVGQYVSYCRKVPSSWTSNGKSKGAGNKKNGSKYLAWAYSEAAELARRHDGASRAYYQRKAARSSFMVAHGALAHKLARAAYYVMRDGVAFEPNRLFGADAAGAVNQVPGLAEPRGLIGNPPQAAQNGQEALYCP